MKRKQSTEYYKKLCNKLVDKFKSAGYNLLESDTYPSGFVTYHMNGHKTRFGFGLPGFEDWPTLDGRIAMEYAEKFNKYSQCPVYIPLPETEEEFTYVLELLKDSKNFTYTNLYDNPPTDYPRHVHKKSKTYILEY